MAATYVLGLDLGPPGEPTGFAILERPAAETPVEYPMRHQKRRPIETPPPEPVYRVRHLERFPTGTPYPAIVEKVVERARTPPLQGSPLIVDQTAVGKVVIDCLWKAKLKVTQVVISAGQAVQDAEGGGLQVPKKDLVTVLQVLLQSRRLKVAEGLPEANLLRAELGAFRLRRVALADTDTPEWRVRQHDDLVFAVALACWHAERPPIRIEVHWVESAPSDLFPKGVFRT
jgi:hypothetical protein